MKNVLKKIGLMIVIGMITFASMSYAHAQVGLDNTFGNENEAPINLPFVSTLENSTSAQQSASILLLRATQILLGLAATVAIFFIVYGGFTMIRARGEEDTIKKGKETLTYAVVGLILAILSYSVVVNIANLIFQLIQGT
jgi:hypothetical protein